MALDTSMKIKELAVPPVGEVGRSIIELDQAFFPTPWTQSAWNESRNQDYVLLVLDIDTQTSKRLVGFSLYRALKGDTQAHLLKILVDPEYRGKDFGSSLLKEGNELLKVKGFREVFLEVEDSNFEAVALYKKFNFEVIHKISDFYGKDQKGLMMLCTL